MRNHCFTGLTQKADHSPKASPATSGTATATRVSTLGQHDLKPLFPVVLAGVAGAGKVCYKAAQGRVFRRATCRVLTCVPRGGQGQGELAREDRVVAGTDGMYSHFGEYDMGWLINGIFSSGITLGFVGIIIVVFITSLIFHIKTVLSTLNNLKDEIEEIENIRNGGDIYSDLLDKFAGISDNCRYFKKILMEYKDMIYSTQDITSTVEELWTPDILKSRIVPVVSTILTGLGVLGTFIGLSFGLKGLQLDGNIEHLQEQIQRVADGASIAFITSICGVCCSLSLTFYGKKKSEDITGKIRELSRLLSFLFPPLPIMQVLVDTHEETKKSTDIQGKLAEQIGGKLQTVFDSFTHDLIQNIANNISSSSEQIKRCIVGDSEKSVSEQLKSVAETGCENLQKTIRGATKFITVELRGLGDTVNRCSDNIKTSIDSNSISLQGTFDECSKNIISGISGSISSTGQQISNTVNISSDNVRKSIIHELKGVASLIETHTTILQGTIDRCSTDILSNIIKIVQTITSSSKEVKQCIASELKNIPSEVRKGVGSMVEEHLVPAIEGLEKAAEELAQGKDEISKNISDVGQKISNTVTTSSGNVTRSIVHELKGITSLIEENTTSLQGTLDRYSGSIISEISESISDAGQQISNTVGASNESAKTAIVSELKDIIPIIKMNYTNLQDIVSGCSTDISSTISKIVQTITSSSEEVKQGIASELKNIPLEVKEGVGSMVEEHLVPAVNELSGVSGDIREIPEKIKDGIGKSIDDKLIPAIEELKKAAEELAQGKAESSETALGQLVEKFIESMGTEGNKQRTSLEETTKQLNESIEYFTQKMTSLMGEIKNQRDSVEDTLQAQIKSIIEQFQNAVREELDKLNHQMGMTSEEVQRILEQIAKSMDDFIGKLHEVFTTTQTGQTGILEKFRNDMQEFLKLLKEYQNGINTEQDKRGKELENIIKGILESITNQINSTKSLLTQGSDLQEKINICKDMFDELSNSVKESSESLEQASGHLQESSANLQKFSSNISESMNRGATSVERAVRIVSGIEARQEEVNKKFDIVTGGIEDASRKLETVRISLEAVGQSLSGSAQQVTEGFEKAKDGFTKLADHYTEFQQDLNAHMEKMDEETRKQLEAYHEYMERLADHMATLLRDYSASVNQQVTSRMTAWNDLTEQFCKNMTSVVHVMEVLVSSLDIKRKQGEKRS